MKECLSVCMSVFMYNSTAASNHRAWHFCFLNLSMASDRNKEFLV